MEHRLRCTATATGNRDRGTGGIGTSRRITILKGEDAAIGTTFDDGLIGASRYACTNSYCVITISICACTNSYCVITIRICACTKGRGIDAYRCRPSADRNATSRCRKKIGCRCRIVAYPSESTNCNGIRSDCSRTIN